MQEPQTLKGAAGRNQNPKMSKTLEGAAGARWSGWVQKPKPLKEQLVQRSTEWVCAEPQTLKRVDGAKIQ